MFSRILTFSNRSYFDKANKQTNTPFRNQACYETPCNKIQDKSSLAKMRQLYNRFVHTHSQMLTPFHWEV